MKAKLSFFLIFILTLTYSCHKFDENLLLFKKPEKYIFGNKKISRYLIDGVDNTNKINNKVNYFEFFDIPNEWNPDEYDFDYFMKDTNTYGDKLFLSGCWSLNNHKKNLFIREFSVSSYVPTDSVVEYILYKKINWDIIKLKSEIIKLETDDNNHHYQLELIPE